LATKESKIKKVEAEGNTPQGGKEVKLSSLKSLQAFTHKGETYSKRRVHAGGVTCLSIKGDRMLTLPLDTLVTPKQSISK
jgi:hypothetical protein